MAGRKEHRRVELIQCAKPYGQKQPRRFQIDLRNLTARATVLRLLSFAASHISERWLLRAGGREIGCESSCNMTGLQDGRWQQSDTTILQQTAPVPDML
jgi:hypothetical protein